MNTPSRLLAFSVVPILLMGRAQAQVDAFVDSNNVSGIENGLTWNTAFTNPQTAINAVLGTPPAWTGHILVAEGTYQPAPMTFFPPSSSVIRARAFIIVGDRDFIELHGGFLGLLAFQDPNSPDPSIHPDQPDGKFRKTILTGTAFLSWSVLAIDELTGDLPDAVVIDGFAIKGGQSDGLGDVPAPTESVLGGGIFARLTEADTELVIENVRFEDNFARDAGGGLYLTSPNANVSTVPALAKIIVRHCRFEGNHAGEGAGLWAGSGSIRLGSNRWVDNGSIVPAGPPSVLVPTTLGGVVYLGHETHLLASNCLMYGNAAVDGGAVYYLPPVGANDSTDIFHLWRNCTIVDNDCLLNAGGASPAGGVAIDPGSTFDPIMWPIAGVRTVDFDNCIVWGNAGLDISVRGQVSGQTLQGGVLATVSFSNIGTFGFSNLAGSGQLDLVDCLVDVDPQFVNPAADNYSLFFDLVYPSKSSPCIDGGVDASRGQDYSDIDADDDFSEFIGIDKAGELRLILTGTLAAPPWGETVDMGAFECTKGIILNL